MRKINKNNSREIRLDGTRKEKIGWMILAEESMNKIRNNKKENKTWNKYLKTE